MAGGNFVGAVPLNQCEPAPPANDPRRQIRNAGVPVIRIMSQSDYLLGIGARREDGNTRADRFRHYEMAGAAHATPDELYYSAAPADIVAPAARCRPRPATRARAAASRARSTSTPGLRNLDLWTRTDPGAAGRQIDVVNGAPVLDAYGNVTGGLRSPFVDVPTSTWYGSSTGASFCFIAGHEVPLDDATLRSLYPTHGVYVRKVVRDVGTLVAQRYLTVPDGLQLIRDAARADVP